MAMAAPAVVGDGITFDLNAFLQSPNLLGLGLILFVIWLQWRRDSRKPDAPNASTSVLSGTNNSTDAREFMKMAQDALRETQEARDETLAAKQEALDARDELLKEQRRTVYFKDAVDQLVIYVRVLLSQVVDAGKTPAAVPSALIELLERDSDDVPSRGEEG